MKKADISAHVGAQASLSKGVADTVVDAVFGAISEALGREEAVTIAGFGTFTTKSRAAREGRNPRTGEPLAIAASRTPAFKPAKALRDALNPR